MIRALQIPSTSSGQLDRPESTEEFCNRWKKDVFAFCRMFLGVDAAAEDTACEVLVRFCQEQRYRLSDSETATRLLALAFRLVQPSREERNADRVSPSRLHATLQQPPAMERVTTIAIASERNRYRESLPPRTARGGSSLDRAILRLPVTERAVLIARNLLRMDWESVAHATGLSAKQAHRCWVNGVIRLNDFLRQEDVRQNTS